MDVLLSGVPLTAKEILMEAMNEAFGEGTLEFIELNKENLRQRVRLSSRNVADVLVVLDRVSTDTCKDIENGLYETDKFFTYTTDEELVSFLNNKYGLSLVAPSSAMEISSDAEYINQEEIDRYNARIENQELLINDLNARIHELNKIIEMGDYESDSHVSSEEVSTLKKENLELREQFLNVSSENKTLDTKIKNLIKERDDLKISVEKLEKKRKSLLADLESISGELTDYKVKYSTQSGLMRSKDSEIESLREKLNSVSSIDVELKNKESEYDVLKEQISALTLESSKYKVDLESKDREIAKLKEELNSTGSEGDGEEEELNKALAEKDELLKESSEKDSTIGNLKENMGKLKEQITSLEEEKSKLELEKETLEGKLTEADNNLVELNKQHLEMLDELNMLRRSTSRDSDIEEVLAELSDLRRKYDTLSSSVFSKISSLAMPNGSSRVHLTRGGVTLNHIRFVFAGSTESRKGAYKALLNEFKGMQSNDRILIVDAVSETSIDYVFEIKKVKTGIDWFRRGGGVQNYISSTCLDNVKVLSAGLGYINDSYLLTVDWESRLTELENSGYNVILFCGDISNIVGRVMHESFASLGNSMIYVHGNAIGSRTIVSNLRGLSNSKDSIVCYFEFNKQMRRFYQLVEKNNECRVLSMI